jgi:hypothetical protein
MYFSHDRKVPPKGMPMAKNLGYELLMRFESVITKRLNTFMDSFVLYEVITVFIATPTDWHYTIDLFVDSTIFSIH